MWAYVLGLMASFVSVLAIVRSLMLVHIRADRMVFRVLKEEMDNGGWKLLLTDMLTPDEQPNQLMAGFCWPKGCPPIYFDNKERMLQAGWAGVDIITEITCFRWHAVRLRKFLHDKIEIIRSGELGVSIEIQQAYGSDLLGRLKEKIAQPLVQLEWTEYAEEEIEKLFGPSGHGKLGLLVYGPPGNGKTSLAKYLATKYMVPVKIMLFNPENDNSHIMRMFAGIPRRCLVLLEDFDSYFDGRTCKLSNGQTKFTFDVILNCLDGVYNTYEQVLFMMTVNDIERVDPALKQRPTRFKYVGHFTNPGYDERLRILDDDREWTTKTCGMNLDQLLRMRELRDAGVDFDTASNLINAVCPITQPATLVAAAGAEERPTASA